MIQLPFKWRDDDSLYAYIRRRIAIITLYNFGLQYMDNPAFLRTYSGWSPRGVTDGSNVHRSINCQWPCRSNLASAAMAHRQLAEWWASVEDAYPPYNQPSVGGLLHAGHRCRVFCWLVASLPLHITVSLNVAMRNNTPAQKEHASVNTKAISGSWRCHNGMPPCQKRLYSLVDPCCDNVHATSTDDTADCCNDALAGGIVLRYCCQSVLRIAVYGYWWPLIPRYWRVYSGKSSYSIMLHLSASLLELQLTTCLLWRSSFWYIALTEFFE